MTTDPNIVRSAPNVAVLLGGAVHSADQLSDRARGVILGLAVGNLLGLPIEGDSYRHIQRAYPDGVRDIDHREAQRPMDDDLAQAVELGEALVDGGDYVNAFANRLVVWARENGRGMGILTSQAIRELGAGHAPPEAARILYERNPIAPNGGVMRCAPVALARLQQPALLVSDSAATCIVTHYAVTCQWSCVLVNAVIALLLRGVTPDLPVLMAAASSDSAPDMLSVAERDDISTQVLASIVDGTPLTSDAFWLRQEQRHIGHTVLALQCGLWAAVTELDFEAALRGIIEGGGTQTPTAQWLGPCLGRVTERRPSPSAGWSAYRSVSASRA